MDERLMTTWAGQEMSGAILKDKRQQDNLTRMCLKLQQNPGLSFSAACGPAVRKAAWRLFSGEDIDLLHGHATQTALRCQEENLVLIAEDTTDLNYDGHQETVGLGQLSGPSYVLGLAVHSAMAMRPSGEPLGLIGQHIWAPVCTQHRKGKFLQKLPIEEKESYKWLRTLQWVKHYLNTYPGDIFIIGDREGDFYEHFTAPRNPGVDLLVRALHLKRKVLFEGGKLSLLELAALLPAAGITSIEVPRTKDRPERLADLEVRFGVFTCPPSDCRRGPDVRLSLVVVKEINVPQGVADPIEWYLLTTCLIDTLEAALELVKYYKLRWVIERFHYVLKQGLRVERLQFDTVTRLSNALKVCSIVAWYMLRLAYLVKTKPTEKASEHFDPLEIEILKMSAQKNLQTVADVALALGRLAGFVPSKKQLWPGEKLLWQATKILLNMKTGFLMGKNYGTG